MRKSRSDKPSASSPPSARRQRRRRSSCGRVIGSDPENELEQRQSFRERFLVNRAGKGARRRSAAADLLEQAPAFDRPEARKRAPQQGQYLKKVLFLRQGEPFIDDREKRLVVQNYSGAFAEEALQKGRRGARRIGGRERPGKRRGRCIHSGGGTLVKSSGREPADERRRHGIGGKRVERAAPLLRQLAVTEQVERGIETRKGRTQSLGRFRVEIAAR